MDTLINHLFDAIGDLLPFIIFVVVGLYGLIKKGLSQQNDHQRQRRVQRRTVEASDAAAAQKAKMEKTAKNEKLEEVSSATTMLESYQNIQMKPRSSSTSRSGVSLNDRYKDRSNEIVSFTVKKENLVEGIIWSEILGKPRAYQPLHRKK
ncbi:hypothetical protein GA0061096_2106 [Fictibacillus enclensis]|uniref:Uncharacterized protein n=1 Tax=Fictibacillus enclensis TaxID=1017270 RepID=A0A0V8JFC8_9BACL|nr:hypothetical protein [Fictibacillus enclensis]KSU85807.1 hypothetical protein AS030_10045 [Fictibacillus enclensis]SCC02973.1 hypothetical protein GA0061096_2106 [Fictibacillus enclensis]